MNILVNGQPQVVDKETTIGQLLGQLQLPSRQLAVEVNLQLVPREQHAEYVLQDGDQLEVVTLAGGG